MARTQNEVYMDILGSLNFLGSLNLFRSLNPLNYVFQRGPERTEPGAPARTVRCFFDPSSGWMEYSNQKYIENGTLTWKSRASHRSGHCHPSINVSWDFKMLPDLQALSNGINVWFFVTAKLPCNRFDEHHTLQYTTWNIGQYRSVHSDNIDSTGYKPVRLRTKTAKPLARSNLARAARSLWTLLVSSLQLVIWEDY